MINFKRVVLPIFIMTLSSCLFDSGTDKVVDDYEVVWIDLLEERALCKLVPPYVFAVGHDAKFVFAKQHPLKPNSNEKIDKSVVNYYIIERTENGFQDKPVYGPLAKEEFDNKCAELGIRDVEFDMTYSTNL